MKKITTLALVSAALVAGAFAQPPKPKPVMIACAVMPSNKVDATKAPKGMFADYKGNRYYFCCAGCPAAFKASPAKYVSAAHIPVAKAPKPPKA